MLLCDDVTFFGIFDLMQPSLTRSTYNYFFKRLKLLVFLTKLVILLQIALLWIQKVVYIIISGFKPTTLKTSYKSAFQRALTPF